MSDRRDPPDDGPELPPIPEGPGAPPEPGGWDDTSGRGGDAAWGDPYAPVGAPGGYDDDQLEAVPPAPGPPPGTHGRPQPPQWGPPQGQPYGQTPYPQAPDDPTWEEWNPSEEYFDADWARLPRRTSWWFKALVFIGATVAVLGAGAYFANSWLQDQLDPPGEPGTEVVIEIPSGAAVGDVARILSDEGVVSNTWVFRQYLGLKDLDAVQAGSYTFRADMAVWDAKDVLLAGPDEGTGGVTGTGTFNVTVPEGLWLSEIGERLVEENPEFVLEEFQQVIDSGLIRSQYQPEDVSSLEGLLFPDTYQLDGETAAEEGALIRRMVDQFDSVASELGLDNAERATGFSPYEVVIIASMIEAEAKVDEDRAKIARVIYNRLAQGEILGIDATVNYAVNRRGPITQSDLEFESPYNTRLNPGLPPTPIAAPGRASLEAALNPAEGPWIYYVLADEDGRHFFTDSAAEFEQQVELSREQGLL